MKVLITFAGIGVLGALIMPIAPVAGGILISFSCFLLAVAISGHNYYTVKKKWREEEQEARRAQAEAQPVPPPGAGSPVTATPGSGTGNDTEVPMHRAWTRTPSGIGNTDDVSYSTEVAIQAPGGKGLELEINE